MLKKALRSKPISSGNSRSLYLPTYTNRKQKKEFISVHIKKKIATQQSKKEKKSFGKKRGKKGRARKK